MTYPTASEISKRSRTRMLMDPLHHATVYATRGLVTQLRTKVGLLTTDEDLDIMTISASIALTIKEDGLP